MPEEIDGCYQAKKDHYQDRAQKQDEHSAPKAGYDKGEDDHPDQLPRIDPVHHRLLFLTASAF